MNYFNFISFLILSNYLSSNYLHNQCQTIQVRRYIPKVYCICRSCSSSRADTPCKRDQSILLYTNRYRASYKNPKNPTFWKFFIEWKEIQEPTWSGWHPSLQMGVSQATPVYPSKQVHSNGSLIQRPKRQSDLGSQTVQSGPLQPGWQLWIVKESNQQFVST